MAEHFSSAYRTWYSAGA